MAEAYAEVVVSISHKSVDRVFLYKIPSELSGRVGIGASVAVPFGRGNKRCEGFVTGIADKADIDGSRIKSILDVSGDKPLFSERLLHLALWMQSKYYATLIDCLKCIMPTGVGMKNDTVVTLLENAADVGTTAAQSQAASFIRANGGRVLMSELENELGAGAARAVKALAAKGAAEIGDVSEFSNLTLKVKFAYANYDGDAPDEALERLRAKKPAQARVLELLMGCDGMAVSDIKKLLGVSGPSIKALAEEGLIFLEETEVFRGGVAADEAAFRPRPELTADQARALRFIESRAGGKPVLIRGVTGSGKTEIYMRLIERAINAGKQAIMLVPEISLTPQTVGVFAGRFGGAVAVTHSRMTLGERYDQWKRARDGLASIMIGPRSAVFAPFERLGVIIVDEEHEKTYKSETTPKYSAVEAAIQRGRLEGALVVLGSATPSMESYYEAECGRMELVTIEERINRALPQIYVVDMRNELAEGNMSIFSAPLFGALEENLDRGGQAILFLNRRGFSTFVCCRKCGYVMKCDNCSVNYTYHKETGRLMCHYCGKKAQNPENCPQCGSKYIRHFGTGTQKIEQEAGRLFPGARILRMDTDSTTGKHMHERILQSFRDGGADILIGTQMIAKGLDFPNVTLVGVMAADMSLNTGDFRAAETTYQLLTQVSGRAGRAERPGRVFIQTYNPEHYSVVHASVGDYEQFYAHELSLRRQMAYPPFTHVFCVLFTGEDEKKLIVTLFRLIDIMKYCNRKGTFEMLGPAPAHISKIRKRYRWKVLVKSADEERLKSFVLYCVDKLKASEDISAINVSLTLNPTMLI